MELTYKNHGIVHYINVYNIYDSFTNCDASNGNKFNLFDTLLTKEIMSINAR